MQKVIRATSRAKTQAQRKIIAEQSKNRKVDRRLLDNERQQYRHEITSSILNAKKARKEDWMLGPLAPRRDVGDQKDTYGTVSTRLITAPNKPKGQWKDWYIRKDDRVVIVGAHHKERGKIGKVKEVDREAEFCLIEGLNLVCTVPLYDLIDNHTRCKSFMFEVRSFIIL